MLSLGKKIEIIKEIIDGNATTDFITIKNLYKQIEHIFGIISDDIITQAISEYETNHILIGRIEEV